MKKFKLGLPPDFKKNGSKVLRSAFMSDQYMWNLKMLNLEEIHQKYTGIGIKVGILDTGGFIGHPDLDDNNTINRSFVGGDMMDNINHGTHVRGIIAMQKNGQGLIGVSPDVIVYNAKVISENGGTDKELIEAIHWLVDSGCQVINGSLAFDGVDWIKGVAEAIEYAHSKNVAMVFSSGNEDANTVSFPASHPLAISTGAVDFNKALANFSNQGEGLDIVAPGVRILSSTNDGDYQEFSGTSMAAPHVTGVIALLIQKYILDFGHSPTVDYIKSVISHNAEDLNTEGVDTETGAGLITTNFSDEGLPEENDEPNPIDDWTPNETGCLTETATMGLVALVFILVVLNFI